MDTKKFEEMMENEMKMNNMEIIIEEKDCIECVCDNCNNNCSNNCCDNCNKNCNNNCCNKEKKD